MRKITVFIISFLVAGIVFVAGNAYIQKKAWSEGVAKLDEWSIIEGNEFNGGIGDIVIGNKDAKVKIIEYADFQCSACATTFPYIHEVVKEYGDQIAYVYRNYAINYHQNATAAASAAVASLKLSSSNKMTGSILKAKNATSNLKNTSLPQPKEKATSKNSVQILNLLMFATSSPSIVNSLSA